MIQKQLDKIDGNVEQVEQESVLINGRLRVVETAQALHEKLCEERRQEVEKALGLVREIQHEDREAIRREMDTSRVAVEATRARISDLGDRLQLMVFQKRESGGRS